MDFPAFYETFLLKGLENFRKYYGIYRATVIRNDDPDQRGRIQVQVPRAGHLNVLNIWIDPVFDGAGTNRGAFFPPEVGDSVRVAFDNGRPDKPVMYLGGWFGTTDLPSEFAYTQGIQIQGQTGQTAVPEIRGFITRKGQRIIFDDTNGQETVTLAWHQPDPQDPAVVADGNGDRSKTANRSAGNTSTLVFNSDGDIEITNSNGSNIKLSSKNKNITVTDQTGNSVTMDNTGVTINSTKNVVVNVQQLIQLGGPTFSALLGELVQQYLATHTHGTAWGPSTPPIVPPPSTILSQTVKLK